MSAVCSHCSGTDIEYDQARGDAVCTSCGSVLEDNIIVSEVTFVEQGSGSSSVIGQFVSSEGSKHPLSGTGFHHGLGKDSREVTLQQAKRRLTDLAHLLKLNQHCIDSAFMFFKMALQMNLTRGRKSSIIDTACLYLVCRSEGTPHLLLDFSDVLQINVYALGRAYLRLSNALHINPPAIDPCLYIHRFAHKLELGERTHEVSMTALRLVARMKRDWIHHGRRPAGLCGAALLVAARLHNFNRTVREVARVVKLSEGTIRKRLGDFKHTPSSRLTIEEFLKIDLEQEHDPPSFTESKKKSKQPANLSTNDDETKHTESGLSEHENAEEEEGVKGEGRGFGGIKMASVEEIIAKARFNESYLNINLGLSESLEPLAKHFESEEEKGSENVEEKLCQGTGELDLTGIDDSEIDNMLLSENEIKIKTQLWFAENGDYLKEQEIRRERLASIKADKEKDRKSRPQRSRRTKNQTAPATSAGEAIERMLVERKISTKINYDVLRDLAKGLSDPASSNTADSSTGNMVHHTSWAKASSGECLKISKSPPNTGRLPSLTTRKRNFSSFNSVENALPAAKYGRVGVPPSIGAASSDTISNRVRSVGRCVGGLDVELPLSDVASAELDLVVEESGPVEYCGEDEPEEGMDDREIEQLAYEGDPLLNSDYEDEGDFCEEFED